MPETALQPSRTTSHWPADTSTPLLEITVGDLLRRAAATAPDAMALMEPDARRAWNYGELLEQSERVARALAGRFESGERVAVWAPNSPEWAMLEFGAALAGLVLVTVNPAYRPGELAYALRQSGAAGICMVPRFRSPMAEYIAEVRPELPGLREVVLLTEWEEFLASGSAQQPLPEVRPGDAAQIQYTSGTTGFPKGALLHHRGIVNNARLYSETLKPEPGEAHINCMPMFHTAGCVIGTLGAAAVQACQVPLVFDPAAVLDAIESTRASRVLGVPTMLVAMLEEQQACRRDLSSLRWVVSGGSIVPRELVRRVKASFGCDFSIVFGTTECSPLLTMTRPDDADDDVESTLGRALPQTEIKVANAATGEAMPIGQVGELCARGYLVMTGYYEMPDATEAAIDDDCWYHTGDLASMDARGFLRVEGRLKDMLIRGGENIYPREIEDALLAHPAVAEVAVVGMPDERWGEQVAAFIRVAPNATVPAPEELRSWCRDRLAAYKTPVRWEFVDAFPMTASGKIQKYQLRQRLAREAGAALSEDVLRASSPATV